MKKLFISQPMSGKTDEEILAERQVAIEKAKEIVSEEVEVIDTQILHQTQNHLNILREV